MSKQVSKSDSFDYPVGGFYVSDDDNSLIHLYYTPSSIDKTDNGGVSSTITSTNPKAKIVGDIADNGSLTGTTLKIKHGFAMLYHEHEQKESQLFINQLEATVDAQVSKDDVSANPNLFLVQLVDSKGEQIGAPAWALYTRSTVNPQPQHDGKDAPSVSTSINNDKVLDNSMYTATLVRDVLYLYDLDATCYALTVTKLKTVENAYHDETDD